MTFVLENIRLKELFLVANQNKGFFDDFLSFLKEKGYLKLSEFISEPNDSKAKEVLLNYLERPLPSNVFLYDGIARPYTAEKAKWLFLGWIFRDAPEQRLRPIISSIPGSSTKIKQATLYNDIRKHVAQFLIEPERWEWVAISEVIADRLEGSRRAIKGTLFEAIVRTCLEETFSQKRINIQVSKTEIKLDGETYDVRLDGSKGTILIPVKTRETMGGGHALLFTRDIHKSISVAHAAGYNCVPVIIAESWAGDTGSLNCEKIISIGMNPNQIAAVTPILQSKVDELADYFRLIE